MLSSAEENALGEVETSPKQEVAIVKSLEAIVKPLEIRPDDPDDDSRDTVEW